MQPLSLSDKMKEILKECHQRELDGIEPCSPVTHGFADELLIHGLLDMKPHTYENRERKAAYFVTQKGKDLLKGLL